MFFIHVRVILDIIVHFHLLACSSRMVGLVQLLVKSNSANALIEDYAACLEARSEESQVTENINDPGILIMQVNSETCILLTQNIKK